jgi:hypothetical protein
MLPAPTTTQDIGLDPANSVLARYWRHALPPALAEALSTNAEALAARPPNYWVPRAVVTGTDPPRTAFEQAVACLYARIIGPALQAGRGRPPGLGRDGGPALPPAWTGAEVWCQTYTGGRGLDFHWDKCEAAMAERGVMRCPAVGCVVYLAGAGEGEGGRGDEGGTAHGRLGPTVIQDQRWPPPGACGDDDGDAPSPMPPHPTACALAFPTKNAVCVFAGNRAHGVLSSPPAAWRAALLVNFWVGHPPGGVERVEDTAGLAGPVGVAEVEGGGAGPDPEEVEAVGFRLPPPPGGEGGEGEGGGYGHALSSLLTEKGENQPRPVVPDLVVVAHAGYDLVEADGGRGCEPAWVACGGSGSDDE